MKKVRFLFLTALLLLFGACSEQPDADGEKEGYRVIEGGILNTCTYSDLGILQSKRDGEHRGVCYFFDPVSEREVPLCTKTNCTHQGYGGGNKEPDCDACISENLNCAAIIGDSLYYVSRDSEDGLFQRKICRADPNGTNRKVLEVMEEAEVFSQGFYEDGYLIYIYFNQTAQDGTPLEKKQSGICLYNLESNEAEYIVEENYGGSIISAEVQDHILYYIYFYLTEDFSEIDYEEMKYEGFEKHMEAIGRTELWSYDLDTKEKRLVMKLENETYTPISFIRGGYMYMEGKYGARLMNLSTGVICELDYERVRNKVKTYGEEGVFLCGEGSIDLLKYNTGEVENIGNYDENMMLVLNYIGNEWVYGENIVNGTGQIFYLPKQQFMKGDLEWNYIP